MTEMVAHELFMHGAYSVGLNHLVSIHVEEK